jgi:hypothetical protein
MPRTVAGPQHRCGDGELADFFRRVRDEDSMRANESRRLLAERSPTTTATDGMAIEPVKGTTAPSEGLAAGAPRREETFSPVKGRPDMCAASTDPGIGADRVEPDVGSRTSSVPSRARDGRRPTREGREHQRNAPEGGIANGRCSGGRSVARDRRGRAPRMTWCWAIGGGPRGRQGSARQGQGGDLGRRGRAPEKGRNR